MRTFLLIVFLTSFCFLSSLKSQCSGVSVSANLINQGCGGNCGIIVATATGTAPYTYQLYKDGIPVVGATNDTSLICTSGIYYYYVIDANNCTVFSNTVTYSQATTPLSAFSYTITNYSGFPVSCNGNADGCIKVVASNGFPSSGSINYTYDIGGGPTSRDTFCNLGAGIYTVTVSDFLGCETTSTITLTEPSLDSIDFLVTQPICPGTNGGVEILSLCGGGCTYAMNGNPPQNQLLFTAFAGWNYFEIYNNSGCLINYDSVLLVNPPSSTVSINAPSGICRNDTTTLTCQVTGNLGPYTYVWDNLETTQTTRRGYGAVAVTVTDANGCVIIARDTILEIPMLDSMAISPNLDPFGLGHCVNADSTILDVILITGSAITNGVFYGAGVRNGLAGPGVSTFYPDSAEIDMGHVGDVKVDYIYTTTTGCVDTTSFTTKIHSLPNLSINLPDSICPDSDSFQLIAINQLQLGVTGQITAYDTLINEGVFVTVDENGNSVPSFIQLFDTLVPSASIGYNQLNISYTYTSPSIFGFCTNTIFDSVRIEDCCVWPGDANSDGIANNFDLLPIGLHHSNIGLSRLSQTIDYNCHASDAWGMPISGLPSVDQKHADCNGNGLINGLDTNAIILNWSQTHLKNSSIGSAAVSMYIDTAVMNPGDTITLDVILNQALAPVNGYGLAFTINYDPLLVDTGSVYVTFDNSWLGIINSNMIGIQKDFYAQGEIEVGLSRIDQVSVIGNGPVAQMHFIIKDDVLPKTLTKRMDLSVDNILLVDNTGAETPVVGISSQVLITNTALNNPSISTNLNNEIQIAPNPFENRINVMSKYETIEEINLYNLTGQLLQPINDLSNSTETITLQVPSGIYFLNVKTATSNQVFRIIKK